MTQIQMLIEDDLFARPPRRSSPPALQHRITCAVCGVPAAIFVGAPGDLCASCRGDVVATRAHVEDVVERARARLHVLIDNLENAVARESEADQVRWAAVVEARVKGPPDVFRARWQKTLQLGDGLARILAAHAAYEAGCREVERVEAWGEKALAACEGANA
jgi:hypothetical protein